jgi:magnesium transporter
MRLLPPDDAADVLQDANDEERAVLLELLDAPTRREVRALMAYAEDAAGGLMSTRFAIVRPDMLVDEAISYLRRQTQNSLETVYYTYVINAEHKLLGVVSFRELFTAPGDKRVREVMITDVISVPENMDQEQVAKLFAEQDLMAIPVVDDQGRIKGIVTVDDIVDVVQEEATEDIQKIGGMQALEAPYLETGFCPMLRKRGGWLSVLFFGELMATAAMSRYEKEIEKAVVLTFFVPLIISSGGNSGSQASTLVIRAMALGEVRLRDWWRVIRREIASGLGLGVILAVLGLLRIVLWETARPGTYGESYLQLGLTVALSLMGVVICGTVAGSMLPFALRRLGFDPASASAPFVATLVDVCGLIIYFNVAWFILQDTLLR